MGSFSIFPLYLYYISHMGGIKIIFIGITMKYEFINKVLYMKNVKILKSSKM